MKVLLVMLGVFADLTIGTTTYKMPSRDTCMEIGRILVEEIWTIEQPPAAPKLIGNNFVCIDLGSAVKEKGV